MSPYGPPIHPFNHLSSIIYLSTQMSHSFGARQGKDKAKQATTNDTSARVPGGSARLRKVMNNIKTERNERLSKKEKLNKRN